MGRTKDLSIEVRISAETSEEHWDSLPTKYQELFTIKRIEVEKIQAINPIIN